MANAGTVTVRTYRRAREIVGTKCYDWEVGPDGTVRDLLAHAESAFGLDPEECIVMIHGRNINHLEGMATPLSPGDAVSLTVDPTPD